MRISLKEHENILMVTVGKYSQKLLLSKVNLPFEWFYFLFIIYLIYWCFRRFQPNLNALRAAIERAVTGFRAKRWQMPEFIWLQIWLAVLLSWNRQLKTEVLSRWLPESAGIATGGDWLSKLAKSPLRLITIACHWHGPGKLQRKLWQPQCRRLRPILCAELPVEPGAGSDIFVATRRWCWWRQFWTVDHSGSFCNSFMLYHTLPDSAADHLKIPEPRQLIARSKQSEKYATGAKWWYE